MSQIPTALFDETICDQFQSNGSKVGSEVLHNDVNQEFMLCGSDGDSDSEEIDISELRKRMWKDQMLLNKLEGTSKQPAAERSEQSTNTCIQQRQPSRKTELRAEDGVLHYMLKVMRDCDARGFVYGILPNTGPPITGSSDSLRAWWKNTVKFDQNAPPAAMDPEAVLRVVEQSLVSNLHSLEDLNDNTVDSILSALIQHCNPPQRSCPLDQGLAPPWWPTGDEMWWGLQGQVHSQLGPPPYRKPHDLRKGWKLSLLAAVIKHMSPRFDDMRSLVWQSKRLQHKMSAKDADTWSRVLNQEEALVEGMKKSLVINTWDNTGGRTSGSDNVLDYAGDDIMDTHKRKWQFGTKKWCGGDSASAGLYSNLELDTLLHNKLEGSSKLAVEQSVQGAGSYQCSISDGSGKGGSSIIYGSDTNKKKLWRFENEGGSEEGFVPGDLWTNDQELDVNSINQLMRFYPQECLNADLGSLI